MVAKAFSKSSFFVIPAREKGAAATRIFTNPPPKKKRMCPYPMQECTVPSSCYPAPSLGPIFGQYLGSGGVDRRPNDVCERGMVSYIRIIASHLLGPNNL